MRLTETQIRIRRKAMSLETREQARRLTKASNYTIRRVRVVVDGDCDFTEWGTRYRVTYEAAPSGFAIIGEFDTVTQADREITERATALDGDDCIEWVWCMAPCPADFKPEG